jgi:hypothetical protein
MNRRILPVAALLALLPLGAEAQTPQERLEAAMTRVQSAGVPVSLLESKIEEGQAKGIPMERIAAAIEQRATALTQAQAAMGRRNSDLSEADLTAGADALSFGISEAILQSISETAPRERRAVAITALTELVALEIVPEEALQRVTEALARGPEALANLPGQAQEGQGRRGSPARIGRAPDGEPGGPPSALPTPGQRPGATNPATGDRPGAPNPTGAGRPVGS